MRVRVELHGRERRDIDLDVDEGATVLNVLRTISVRPEAVVTFRGDAPVPVDAVVADGDVLVFVEAASGGNGADNCESDFNYRSLGFIDETGVALNRK